MEVAFDRRVAPWVFNRTTIAVIVMAVLGVLALVLVSRQAFPVVAPLVAIVLLAGSAVVHLYFSDGRLPVFDLGALTILITATYSAVPLLGFWLAGLHWTELSYLPLYTLNPGPAEVGGFAWRHVLYLSSFTAAYLCFRGRIAIACGPTRQLRPTAIAAMAILGAGLLGYFKLLEVIFGVSYDPSYSDLAAVAASADALPLVARQLSHNFFAILFLLKLGALVWVMSRWSDRRWRAVLFVWLAVEGLSTITRMGGRTWYVMLLLATALLYHRLVKPLSVVRATVLVVVLLGGALVYGLARDLGGGLNTVARSEASPWATMNEFQALYGMAYDLHARQMAGTLGPIPWQIYANDIVMLIPSQILPFSKVDPCMGYVQVDGIGLGCVLGVVSNAVIGLDWVELLLRGLGLGVLFAAIHRWYARRQDGYWATMFYLCMCLWCYYTYRGSTFFFAYYIVYRFIPLLVAVRLVQIGLRNLRRLAVVPQADRG
jgi:hypothetical protein